MCKNCQNKRTQTTCTACKYNGPSIPELNIQTGMSYDTAMSYIFEYVSSIQAQDGQTGDPGPAGANGNDGVGIDLVTDNGDGTYTFNFTDGSDFTTSDLTGPVGPTAGPIFYVADGQLSGNRVVDQNGNTITFNNNSVFIVSSSIAPSGGNGSFTLDGYGTLSTDLVEKISSDAGVLRESYGDKSQRFFGPVSFNNFGTASIQKNPNSQALMIVGTGSDGSYRSIFAFGNNGGEFLAQADFGTGPMAQWINTGADYAFSRYQNGAGSSYYDFGMINSNFDIRGIIPSIDPSSATDVFRINKTTGDIEFLIGKLKAILQTGNAGLTTGQWYQDTAANVLANGDKVIAIKQ